MFQRVKYTSEVEVGRSGGWLHCDVGARGAGSNQYRGSEGVVLLIFEVACEREVPWDYGEVGTSGCGLYSNQMTSRRQDMSISSVR